MTTGIITIQDLVQREVLLCVSTLIDELRKKEDCIDIDTVIELYSGPIDYDAAKYELELEHDYVFKHYCTEDNRYYFGVRNEHGAWQIDPIHNDEETAIYEWFEVYRGGSLGDYRSCIFEHWIVTNWLADKLEAKGETIVRDFYGLTIWARSTTGQVIYMDWVIQQVYQDLISE